MLAGDDVSSSGDPRCAIIRSMPCLRLSARLTARYNKHRERWRRSASSKRVMPPSACGADGLTWTCS